jgi:hypothetical protein
MFIIGFIVLYLLIGIFILGLNWEKEVLEYSEELSDRVVSVIMVVLLWPAVLNHIDE